MNGRTKTGGDAPGAGDIFDDASPLDRWIVVTRFPDTEAASKKEVRTTVRRLAGIIPRKLADSKDRLPLLKLGEFGDKRSEKNCLRTNANMLTIDGVEADYDGQTISPEEAERRLRNAGLAALIYTSPSHTPDAPRWRVLAPLARSAKPEERDALCARLNGALGGILHPESFTRSQSFYYGGVSGPPEVWLVDGRALDEADDILPIPKAGTAKDAAKADPPGPFDRARAASMLAAIPVSARDNRETCWRPVGMALHHATGGDEVGFALWDEWSQASQKYDATDQRRVWDSFGRRDGALLTIRSVERMARQYGWAPPPSTLHLWSPAECAAEASRGYVIKRLLAPGDLACIFGAPGAGKSAVTPGLAYAVAQGRPAFGLRTRQGGVLYVAGEDVSGMKGRITALRERHGDAPDFFLVGGVADMLGDDDLAALRKAVSDRRPSLVVFDTLAACFPGLKENEASDMSRVVATARSLTAEGAAVALVHHDTKAEGATPRGHSVLNGALDVAIHLERDKDAGIVRWRLTKNRNGACDIVRAFTIEGIRLGMDEDGDPITAAYAAEVDGPVPVKLPEPARAALDILQDMLRGCASVPEGAWREACIKSNRLSTSDKRNTHWHATDRAVKALVSARRIVTHGGMVSISGQGATGETFDEL